MKQEKVEIDQKSAIWTVALLIVGAVGLAACHHFNQAVGLPDDHPIEQIAESILDAKLGLPPGTIDFTPEE